jgi:hypothetical protein
VADKVIAATLQVNTGSSVENVKAVNTALGTTSQALNTTEGQANSNTEAFGNLKESLGKLPGPLKSVNEGVNTVTDSLKVLAANPIILVITAIVAALYGLYKAFTSTEEGANKVEQIFSGLGAIVTVIRDRVLALGSAVADFFSGNFSKAADEAKGAITGVGDAMTKAYSAAAQNTKAFQDATDDYNRRIAVNRANLDRDMAASRELINDQNATYAQRIKAINDVGAAQKKQSADEVASAQKFVDIAQTNLNLDKNSKTYKDDLATATEKLAGVQQQAAADERNLNRQRTQVEREETGKRDAIAKDAADKKKKYAEEVEAQEKAFDEARKKRLELEKSGYIVTQQQIIDDANELKKQQAEKEKKIDDDRISHQMSVLGKQKDILYQSVKAEDQATHAKITIGAALKVYYDDVLNTASNLFSSLANLTGKQTIAGKAFSIASTAINTYESAIKSYNSLASIPVIGPELGFAAAAAAIANGLATVKQIVAVQVPGGGTASAPGGMTLTKPAAPLAPTVTQVSSTIDQSSINGIGDATSRRAYVLSSDITHDQDRNARLNRAARLGG